MIRKLNLVIKPSCQLLQNHTHLRRNRPTHHQQDSSRTCIRDLTEVPCGRRSLPSR